MYNWLSVRIKNRLGIAYNHTDLDYLQVERVRTFPGLTNVSREGNLGAFIAPGKKKLYFRLHPHSDTYVLEQVFVNADYEPVVRAYADRLGNSGNPRIIDAGANVGYTTAFLLQSMPHATVVCIEPDAGNICMLRKNLENEIERGVVLPLENALMNKTGLSIATENDFRDGKDWSISVRESETESELKSVSIPQIMAHMKWDAIDILKIDIEGAERFLFQEGEDLGWLDKVKLLALEIHDEFDIRGHIYQTLAKYDFDFTDIGETTIATNRHLVGE